MAAKTKAQIDLEAKLARANELLRNLCVAVETADQSSMVQCAGAAREFLDTDGNR